MATSNILPFADTASATDIYDDAQYAADGDQATGNKAGIAKRKLVNKALKQGNKIAAAVAKFIADNQAVNITDSLTVANIAAYLTTAVQAIAGAFASQAEVDAGTVNNKAVTPLTLKNGYAASFTTNGYIKLPSWLGGLIFNWGTAVTPVGGAVAVPMNLNFPTACYGVTAVVANTLSRLVAISGLSTSGFTANTFNTTSGASTGETVYWWSFGK